MKGYGAEVVLSDGRYGMKGAIAEANRLAEQTSSAFIPDQFSNPANAQAHYDTTGPEIVRDLSGAVDVFVAGVGTGGTLTGVARYLKDNGISTEIVAVEPDTSAVLSGEVGAFYVCPVFKYFMCYRRRMSPNSFSDLLK